MLFYSCESRTHSHFPAVHWWNINPNTSAHREVSHSQIHEKDRKQTQKQTQRRRPLNYASTSGTHDNSCRLQPFCFPTNCLTCISFHNSSNRFHLFGHKDFNFILTYGAGNKKIIFTFFTIFKDFDKFNRERALKSHTKKNKNKNINLWCSISRWGTIKLDNKLSNSNTSVHSIPFLCFIWSIKKVKKRILRLKVKFLNPEKPTKKWTICRKEDAKSEPILGQKITDANYFVIVSHDIWNSWESLRNKIKLNAGDN